MNSMVPPSNDFVNLIETDRSAYPPGLRRESHYKQCSMHNTSSSERQLINTAGNALHEAPPPSQSPQRVSVIVPGGVSSGVTLYVNFLDENNKPKTIAAIVPPNSYPGMHFFVEVLPTNNEEKFISRNISRRSCPNIGDTPDEI